MPACEKDVPARRALTFSVWVLIAYAADGKEPPSPCTPGVVCLSEKLPYAGSGKGRPRPLHSRRAIHYP